MKKGGECEFGSTEAAVARMEQFRAERRMNGVVDGVGKIVRYEGIGGLWRGLSPTLFVSLSLSRWSHVSRCTDTYLD